MYDIDKKIMDLHNIAENRNVKVAYKPLPQKDSFIATYNGKTYICLDNRLNDYFELKHLSHEIGHEFCGISKENTPEWLDDIYETRAKNWAAKYLVSYADYTELMRDPFINSDFDMASALNVKISDIPRARRQYELMGLPVSREAIMKKPVTRPKSIIVPSIIKPQNTIQQHTHNTKPPMLYASDDIHTEKTLKKSDMNSIYNKYVSVIRNTRITCDSEMALEMHTTTDNLRCMRTWFQSNGLPISQGELIGDSQWWAC